MEKKKSVEPRHYDGGEFVCECVDSEPIECYCGRPFIDGNCSECLVRCCKCECRTDINGKEGWSEYTRSLYKLGEFAE